MTIEMFADGTTNKRSYVVTGIDPVITAKRLVREWERKAKGVRREFDGMSGSEVLVEARRIAEKERPREVLSTPLDRPDAAAWFAEIAKKNGIQGVQIESRDWTVDQLGAKAKTK